MRDQKLLEHCKDLIKADRRNRSFPESIVSGDETWCFMNASRTNHQIVFSKNQQNCVSRSRVKKQIGKDRFRTIVDNSKKPWQEFVAALRQWLKWKWISSKSCHQSQDAVLYLESRQNFFCWLPNTYIYAYHNLRSI